LIFSGMENISPSDLHFKEYEKQINRALKFRGYVPAKNPEEADIAIFFSYGISSPKDNQYTYSTPIWGNTGVSSSNTQGSVYSYGNFSTFSGTTTYTPSYGITGMQSSTETYTTYLRYMVLSAYDFKAFKESEKEIQLWKTEVTSTGSSGDLRRVFPFLVKGATPFIGGNTGEKFEVILYEDDIEDLKK